MTTNFFRDMENLRREIDDAFKGFGMGRMLEPSFLPGIGTARFPQVNLSQDQDNLYAEVLVPGVDAQDLDLTIIRGAISLSGERKAEQAAERTWHRRERGHGKFMRTLDLPCEVDADRVVARYDNGVLLITLPIAEQAKPKKINVKAR